jgi:hydroxypyruvate isomerase
MPRFAANLTMMFTEWDFLDRFGAAADAGFTAVEYLFPYEHAPEAIAERLSRNQLTQALFNLPPGNWAAGERGLAALPQRFEEVLASVATAVPYIAATGVRRVHLMSGNADRREPGAVAAYRKAVIWTAERLGAEGVDLVIEPINSRNMPGYFLNDFVFATDLIRELALPNLKLQFDIYHRQIMHGDVTMALRQLMPIVGHMQVASLPSRNEPGSG